MSNPFSAAEARKRRDAAEKKALNIGTKPKAPVKAPVKPKPLTQTEAQKAKIAAARKAQKAKEEKARKEDEKKIAAMWKKKAAAKKAAAAKK